MSKMIVAVSGGVDSVVLLDMLSKKHVPDDLIVAHFEHGIRGHDSEADARFVQALSRQYGLQCIIEHGGLGESASEEVAREARYAFLRRVAEKYEADEIVTAHHADDLTETVAINITRGTGWRGLAVFGAPNIHRPLLTMRKRDIYQYALNNGLEWVEDSTNRDETFLRNKLRAKGVVSDESVILLRRLYIAQHALKQAIEKELLVLPESLYSSRYVFIMCAADVATELLRHATAARLTRPQMARTLHAIKTAKRSTMYEAGAGVSLEFSLTEFVVTLR